MKKNKGLSILWTGLIKENPVLVLVLGTCPALAVSTMAVNGLGMGLSVTLVLICSNLFISLLKNFIPDQVRIPSYIVIIAGFVGILQLLVQGYLPDLDKALGIYLPLIVVNCVVLGRAEMFASKNSPFYSVLDGLGMGLGFTLALFIIGSIREILGSGMWMGMTLTANWMDPMTLMILPPGGFFIYGVVIALLNKLTAGRVPHRKSFGCAGCNGCESEQACGADGKERD